MKPLKHFFKYGAPEEDDIERALRLIYDEDCYVRIDYVVRGYEYTFLITPDDDMDSVMARLPKVYGM